MNIHPGLWRRFFDYLSGHTEIPMVTPYGVETDADGRLYVVDTFLKAVHVFDPQANKHYLFSTKDNAFLSPIDIAVDRDGGYLYVSDSKLGVVKIFKDAGRKFVGEIGHGVLVRPTGIAIHAQKGELLVVDTLAANIVRYGLRDHNFKGLFGGTGSARGRLHYPTNIFVAADSTILVTDSLNFRVQLFSGEGRFLKELGSVGDNPGYFSRPKGVAADSEGHIYVVDNLFDNVQIFDRAGRLLLAFGERGSDDGQFWLPSGIFIDPQDRIYVSDAYNKRIQIFQYIKDNGASQ
jgi:DNA-binding beta-propeller fold protein YncE